MIDHVSVGANDIAAARGFYEAVLASVGLRVVDEAPGRFVDFGTAGPLEPEFSIETPTNGRRANPGNGVHVAFRAPTRAGYRTERQDQGLNTVRTTMGRSFSTSRATRSRPCATWNR